MCIEILNDNYFKTDEIVTNIFLHIICMVKNNKFSNGCFFLTKNAHTIHDN
jgi:hypothetical protein